MVEKQGASGCYTVIEEAKFYDDSVKKLEDLIENTESVTVLRKIWAAGIHKDLVFYRLVSLGLEDCNAEALVELMNICSESKKLTRKPENKMKVALSEKVEIALEEQSD